MSRAEFDWSYYEDQMKGVLRKNLLQAAYNDQAVLDLVEKKIGTQGGLLPEEEDRVVKDVAIKYLMEESDVISIIYSRLDIRLYELQLEGLGYGQA